MGHGHDVSGAAMMSCDVHFTGVASARDVVYKARGAFGEDGPDISSGASLRNAARRRGPRSSLTRHSLSPTLPQVKPPLQWSRLTYNGGELKKRFA